MTYYPTPDDIRLLKYHEKELYCKIDLLDSEMAVLDSLEGLVTDGTISIDADADIRRTFSSTIYLSDKHSISKYTPEEWINKYVRVYIGMRAINQEVHWYSQGVYMFNQNGFNYSESAHTLSISCVDLVAKLDGSLGGQLVGSKTVIEKDSNIRNAIIETLRLSDLKECMVQYWDRKVPYDLEYDTGTTIWEILTELRDLYYPFEMYFDDNVFVCDEIPSGYDDPIVLDEDVFKECVISESADVDYSEVKNCVEVWGATLEADYYADSERLKYSHSEIHMKITEPISKKVIKIDVSCGNLTLCISHATVSSDFQVGFVLPSDFPDSLCAVTIYNDVTIYAEDGTSSTKPSLVCTCYLRDYSSQDSETNVWQDATVMKANEYYIIKITVDGANTYNAYYVGRQQPHAVVKLVDKMPSDEEIEIQKSEDNCRNMKFISLNENPEEDSLYNSRFSVEQIGERWEILSGGDYDNYTTDDSAMEVATYEHWKRCRLTDNVNVECLLIPWLDVNQKLSYAAKYLNTDIAVDFIIKKINITLGSGTMSLTLSRYYPYYPYIIDDKYSDIQTGEIVELS